ncbi:MAG: hypothetical protein KAH84_02555 [Thiomargarita sp.]|nr:hypothetical protein [Thiomargarita sp.]
MYYFNKFIFNSFVIFILINLWLEQAIADDFIPKLLYISVNTQVKNANNRIDDYLKKYGKRIRVVQCKEKPCGKGNRKPYRKIRVEAGTENGWIKTLEKSQLVKKVKRLKNSDERLPNKKKIVVDSCENKELPFFPLKYSTQTEYLERLVKKIYQDKCDNCVQLSANSPLAKTFSITRLNKEVLKAKDFIENLTLTCLITEGEIPKVLIIISGKYASMQGKNEKIPTGFQNMQCQYHEQLKIYADKLREQMKELINHF